MFAQLTQYHQIFAPIQNLFPGINTVTVLGKANGVASTIICDQEGYELKSFEDFQNVSLQQYRNQAQSFQWLQPTQLPWLKNETPKQANFDDEMKATVLVIAIPASDGLKDCIFIELSPYLSSIIPSTAETILRSDQKNIIAAMTKKSIENSIRQIQNQHQEIQKIKNYYQAAEQQIDHLQTQNKKLSEQNTNSIRATIYKTLKQFKDYHFEVQPDCIQYFIEKQMPTHFIEKTVQSSIQQLLSLFPEKEIFQLSRHHIMDLEQLDQKDSSVNTHKAKNQKAFQLLEKYENAAIALLSKNKKVNGKNIAQYLRITPPAITDAFKKNERSIAKTLQDNPNRWFQIRNNLRPVQKIVSQNERIAS